MKEFQVRARAFTGQGLLLHSVQVDGPIVRVFDRIAGNYTACHNLSLSACRRIRKIAESHTPAAKP